MRHFGLSPRRTHFGAHEYPANSRSRDAIILTVAGLALLGLVSAIYAIAFGPGIDPEIGSFLSFLR